MIGEVSVNRRNALSHAMHLADIQATHCGVSVESGKIVEDAKCFFDFLEGEAKR